MTTAIMRTGIGRYRQYLVGRGLGPFLIRSTAGSGAVQIAGMLLTFLVGVQLARGLGVEGYGVYGIALAVISLAGVPGEYGVPKLAMREVAAAAGNQPARIFGVLRWADRTGFLIGLGSALVIALLALAIGDRDSLVATAILWGAPVIPLVALARIRGAALQGLHHIARGQIPFLLLRPLAFALLLFAMFALLPDAGAPQAMALNVVTAGLAVMLGHVWLRSRLPAKPAQALAGEGANWFKSALSMALADGLRLSHFQLTTLLLGLLVSAASVGLFRIATSIAVVIAMPITLLSVVVAPILARLFAQDDHRRLQQLCTRAAQAMTISVTALTIPFLLWGRQLIAFVFGPDYAPANTALVILAAGQIATAAFGLNAGLLTMTGHERRVTRAMFWGLLASVLLTVALVPLWAEIGAAIATIGALLVWNVLTWMDARRLVGVQTALFTLRRRPTRPGPDGAER